MIFICLAMSILSAVLIYYFFQSFCKRIGERLFQPLRTLGQQVERKGGVSRKLKEKEHWLRKNGVSYMLGHDMKGITFYLTQACFSVTALAVVTATLSGVTELEKMFLGGAALIIGFQMPAAIVSLSNKTDNAELLSDLKSVYDILKIQMKAGVFVTDILAECFLIVKNRRLKTALRELTNQIYMKYDMRQALSSFQEKFNNTFIDMLVMTLEQSLQSGRTVQMLQDASAQIQDVERALNLKVRQRAERQMVGYQLAVYFGILLVVLFAMYYELSLAFQPI